MQKKICRAAKFLKRGIYWITKEDGWSNINYSAEAFWNIISIDNEIIFRKASAK